MRKQNTYQVNKSRFLKQILFSVLFFIFPILLHSQVSEYNYATGNVKGRNHVGGLAGRVAVKEVKLTNSYARGTVTGELNVGGFAGSNNGAIEKCYSTGKVTGNSSKGGFTGSGSGTATGSYWDMQTSLLSTSSSGSGKNTTEMVYPYASGTYTGWDFSSVWKADQAPVKNNGYPLLLPASVYLLNVRVFPAGSGTVSGAGYYLATQQAIVSETPGQTFVFKGWVKDNKIISTEPIYSLPLPDNTTLVAQFEKKSATNVKDFTLSDSGFKIYPNPVKDMLWIDRSGSPERLNSFRIVNLNGQVVKYSNVSRNNGSRIFVPVTDLLPGFYFFIGEFESGSAAKKFIKY
jgi:hypothetical protein